jgi:hypothetical protein
MKRGFGQRRRSSRRTAKSGRGVRETAVPATRDGIGRGADIAYGFDEMLFPAAEEFGPIPDVTFARDVDLKAGRKIGQTDLLKGSTL